ncbi:unnamed protein product [Owenia fusiformis]|uniref:GPR158/179 extracellular domain-containing protein n=1 Tax=Owenia fusiformis TaxID=6347 RepID=A0A8J1XK70_OWEFU|nr:unnamed protein product [Owenia fusiformis]
MRSVAAVVFAVALVALAGLEAQRSNGKFDWMSYDNFDQIIDRMDSVTPENCNSKPSAELRLHPDTVSQLPLTNRLLSTIIYPNRTSLLHLHNMALNRAFFHSYVNQILNNSQVDHKMQPGLMYFYFSTEADIAANPWGINGSAVMFDNNCSYANWYTNLEFNNTLPLFGPRAWRFDDYNDPTNWLREPTNETLNIDDYGAGPEHNYSNPSYKINQWYDYWMPDYDPSRDSVMKHTYTVGIKFSNETGRFVNDEFEGRSFFGPPQPSQNSPEEDLPVRFTAPYYDCGRSNKWIMSATAPVLDYLPRYLEWMHLRRQRFVAATVLDIDFLTLDFNPCPTAQGNPAPNYFANTARCKPSTICEPLMGYGFQRGGYICMCRPGYRYPRWQNGPYLGVDIERATEEEYQYGFECEKVDWRVVIPIIDGSDNMPTTVATKYAVNKRDISQLSAGGSVDEPHNAPVVSRRKRSVSRWHGSDKAALLSALGLKESNLKKAKLSPRKRMAPKVSTKVEEPPKRVWAPRHQRDTSSFRVKRSFDQEARSRIERIIDHMNTINKDNCKIKTNTELNLPGDLAFGAKEQLQNQARTALRMAHFLSNFLENVDFYEEYGNLRGDRPLNFELLFGEAIANVMGDYKIFGSGVFFDTDKFKNMDGTTRQYFGPYSWRGSGTRTMAIDYAGHDETYIEDAWFVDVKERWQSNVYGLKKWTTKAMLRSNLFGTSLRRFEHYPMYYRAPSMEDGLWSAPYFDCDGYIDDWVITYSVPFFGMNTLGTNIEFKGVVIVDVKLEELDVNQCPGEFHVPNAFKSTARCDYESTYCVPLPGKRFTRGGYKCECLQGFEYPFNDRAWYYDGQTMEEEYDKMMRGERHRFNTLKCREAGAPRVSSGSVLLISVIASIMAFFGR